MGGANTVSESDAPSRIPAEQDTKQVSATYRGRMPTEWEATWLVWYRVPGKLTAISLALSSVVILGILAAGINFALGPEESRIQELGYRTSFGGWLHYIVVAVMLLGFPLLYPALFRLAGRRMGRGRCSPTAASGALFEGDRCVAAYRPDGRLFGYESSALAPIVSSRGANASAGGLLRVPLPTWQKKVGVVLIIAILILIPVSEQTRVFGDWAALPAIPLFALAPILFLSFDTWVVHASPEREQWCLRSWVDWHRDLRAALEAARDATVQRISRWQGRRSHD